MPITLGSAIASEAAERVIGRATQRAEGRHAAPLEEVVNETLYHERMRLAHAPPGERAEADRAFLKSVARDLARGGAAAAPELLAAIVRRYATEITGHFDPRVYRAATTVLPMGLSVLFNGLSPKRAMERFPTLPLLTERVLISGEVDTLRGLQRIGTVVLAPTHSSNLDSILLGYAIFRMGLPPFAYGAGLNLFDSALMGFFMHNLGAYTVDRTKTDPLYRETLKEYAATSLEHGQHNLYFPGGTRSRSGAVEQSLKKGLLGATLPAFANNLRAGRPNPRVFIFPCTCTYPLVLEAASLIDDYLERAGKSHYIHPLPDEFDSLARWVDFFRSLLALDLEVHLRVGRPLDPFGCAVDRSGASRDPRGRPVEPAEYLRVHGAFARDEARDRVYSRMLADAVAAEYRRDNVALATSILAYAVFERLKKSQPSRDLYGLLRALGPTSYVTRVDLLGDLDRLLAELRALADAGEIVLSEEARAGAAALVDRGLSTFATYHASPVLQQRADRIYLGDANLLFFYRNRLDGYGLLGQRALVPRGAS